jgi:hypothetical protein
VNTAAQQITGNKADKVSCSGHPICQALVTPHVMLWLDQSIHGFHVQAVE